MHNTQQPQGFYDIYDLMYTPFWRTTPFLIFVVLVLCTLLIVGFATYWRRRKIVVRTSWEEAFENLNTLQAQQEEIDPGAFYATLTDILKNYFTTRYAYSLREKTDEEIVALLASSTLPQEVKHSAQEIFSRAVAYKFSHAKPSRESMTADLHKAQEIVQQTIPQQQTIHQQQTIPQEKKDAKQ